MEWNQNQLFLSVCVDTVLVQNALLETPFVETLSVKTTLVVNTLVENMLVEEYLYFWFYTVYSIHIEKFITSNQEHAHH